MAEADQINLTALTVDLLSAYVANNKITDGDLPSLIRSTHSALKSIDAPEPEVPAEPDHKPAVSVRKSLSSKVHIISLIDGKPYQTLKRHLSGHGLTPDEYRERYGLPKTYPMVAPAYSESRRAIAERLGLGRKVKGTQAASASSATEEMPGKLQNPASAKAKAKRTPLKAAKAAPVEATLVETGAIEAAPVPVAAKAPAAKKATAPAAKTAQVKKAPRAQGSKAAPVETAATTAAPAPATAKAPRTKKADTPAAKAASVKKAPVARARKAAPVEAAATKTAPASATAKAPRAKKADTPAAKTAPVKKAPAVRALKAAAPVTAGKTA